MKPTVVIVVSGGVVQDCYASVPVEIELIDLDSLEDAEEKSAGYKRCEEVESSMVHVL